MPTGENIVAFFKKRGFNIAAGEFIAAGFHLVVEENGPGTDTRMQDIWRKTLEPIRLLISVVPKPGAISIEAKPIAKKLSLWRRLTAWVKRTKS